MRFKNLSTYKFYLSTTYNGKNGETELSKEVGSDQTENHVGQVEGRAVEQAPPSVLRQQICEGSVRADVGDQSFDAGRHVEAAAHNVGEVEENAHRAADLGSKSAGQHEVNAASL